MKKTLAILLAAIMMLTVLAGCGAQPAPAASAPAAEAPVAEAPAAEAPAEAEPEQQEVTIHLFHQKQEAQEAFAQIIEAFQAEYPYITVEQEIVTNDPAAILKARVATGEVPDIFQGANDTMDIARGGYIMELTGEKFLDSITDEARTASSFTDAEGHTWAMPVDGSCEGIFYNKDIFAQYGLSIPSTLSELEAIVKTLEDNGVTPFAMGFKDAWTIKPVSLVAAASAIYGKDIAWDAKKTSGETGFAADEGWSQTFVMTKYVYEHGNTKTAFDTDYNGACAMMANGEAAMMINGLWALEPIKQINPDVNLGMMAMPVSENADEAKLFQFPDFGLSISASTEYPEECKLFLEFLTRPEIAELWCSTSKLFSAVKGVSVDFDPMADDVNAYIDAGMVCTQVDRGWPTAFGAEYESALSNYILDLVSLEDVMTTLDAAWETASAAQG